MSPKAIKRGYNAEDCRWFSDNAVDKLRIAQREICWLLDHGYKNSAVIDFVGNHYQLSARQRIALQRSTASTLQYRQREAGLLTFDRAADGCVFIDGFNLIISLEVALSGSLMICGNDGVIRDLAGLRGTYSIIGQTERALELIGGELKTLAVPEVKIFLDAPVSNSGRLRKLILKHAMDWDIPAEVLLVPNADPVLANIGRIVSADSVIMDSCESWFNLSRRIIETHIKDAWIVNLTERSE